jgi:nucleotide-binding universal stress UspA family protein
MIKDIAVQLTGSEEDDVRLSFAQVIASHFDAHLLGVHLHTLPDILASTEPRLSGYIQTLLEESNAAADRAQEGLKGKLSRLNGSTELRRLHGLAAGVGGDLARIAREVDLFIGTRPYGDPDARYLIEEAVLFGSGRGCLFLPPGGTPQKSFKTILVAWDGSREAARALAEAMPFLQQATKVFVGQIVDGDQSESELKSASAGVLAHLERHGIRANLSQASRRSSTGEQIHEMAHQRGADLIVMGAYGHARFIEWALGGATRYLLRHSTLPVLMAH